MKFRVSLLASAIGLSCVAQPAIAQGSLASDAKAFGAREAVMDPDLSADGSSVVYVTPGPGRRSFAVVGNLDSGKFVQMTSSDGNPDALRWCKFVSPSRSVCRISGLNNQVYGEVIGFTRLLALNSDGSEPQQLGQRESFYDAYVRQFDASVIDWLQGSDNKILLERDYVPEEFKLGTRLVRQKKGLGVDVVDTSSLSSDHVEQPHDGASSYMSDGLGHVRLMTVIGASSMTGVMTGQVSYLYRTANSKEWKPLVTVADLNNPDFEPLAIDASIDSLYALKKKKNGRMALYAIRLDGSRAETLVAENPHVDIDDVVRLGDGQKVIGYSYSEDCFKTVYFDPEFKALAESLSKALPRSPIVEFADSSRDGRKLLIFAALTTIRAVTMSSTAIIRR
jgi:hypothetical protein